MMFANCVLQEC